MTFQPKLISGLTPLQTDARRIVIQSGVASVGGMKPNAQIEVLKATTVDIDHVGPWGLDRPLEAPGWAQLWGIADHTGVLPSAMILSPSSLGGGLILPDGYNRMRYMGAVFYIKSRADGMRRQVITSWPSPVTFLYQRHDTSMEIEVGPTNGVWQTVDLSDLMPRDARIASLSFISVPVLGSGGTVQVRTPSSGDGGFAVPSGHQATRDIATSSENKIQVRTATAAKCLLRVLGFQILSTY